MTCGCKRWCWAAIPSSLRLFARHGDGRRAGFSALSAVWRAALVVQDTDKVWSYQLPLMNYMMNSRLSRWVGMRWSNSFFLVFFFLTAHLVWRETWWTFPFKIVIAYHRRTAVPLLGAAPTGQVPFGPDMSWFGVPCIYCKYCCSCGKAVLSHILNWRIMNPEPDPLPSIILNKPGEVDYNTVSLSSP